MPLETGERFPDVAPFPLQSETLFQRQFRDFFRYVLPRYVGAFARRFRDEGTDRSPVSAFPIRVPDRFVDPGDVPGVRIASERVTYGGIGRFVYFRVDVMAFVLVFVQDVEALVRKVQLGRGNTVLAFQPGYRGAYGGFELFPEKLAPPFGSSPARIEPVRFRVVHVDEAGTDLPEVFRLPAAADERVDRPVDVVPAFVQFPENRFVKIRIFRMERPRFARGKVLEPVNG